jgi:hypothetical protein
MRFGAVRCGARHGRYGAGMQTHQNLTIRMQPPEQRIISELQDRAAEDRH